MLPTLDYNTLMGIHIDSAKHILELYRIRFRVIRIGDKPFIATRDFVPGRVNLSLSENSIVVCLDFG